MTSDVLTVGPDLSIREAAELFSAERIGGATVVQNGRLVGIVTAHDLLEFISSLPVEEAAVRASGERGILDDHTVEEAMTRAPVRTVTPEMRADLAAEIMRGLRVHRLPVMDGERLVGIVSTLDFVRALAERRIEHRTFIFPSRAAAV